MRLAVLADIHGNVIAFQECVAYALSRGITAFIVLGDYMGELPSVRETMDYLYDLGNQYACYCIRGNREEYMLHYRDGGGAGYKKGNSASGCLLYAYERITEQDLDFMESLPISRTLSFSGLPPLTICHGSPNRVNERMEPGKKATLEVMENESSPYILCGHTHIQGEICHKGKTVWNPGSVGIPLKSGGQTQFMLLHGADGGWKREFISLTYDVDEAIRQIEVSGMDTYAPYWCRITRYMLRGVEIDHGDVLDRAMELCRQKQGQCVWPEIPEECWAQAFGELLPEDA